MSAQLNTLPTTTFDIWVRMPREIRAWRLEGEVPETEAEVIEAIKQASFHIERVIRNDYDVPPKDVTEDIASSWYAAWTETHSVSAGDTLPDFIADHCTEADSGYRGELAA